MHYYFDIQGNETIADLIGTELGESGCPRLEAVKIASQWIAEYPQRLIDEGRLRISVKDGSEQPLCVVAVEIIEASSAPSAKDAGR